ncbi:MAG: addiction module protein [Deltaproteobacteria bacterium]|nr:addiction module protein [Deltaproteobacteria bacterium]
MARSLDEIYENALRLSDESKVILAERIVEYLETNVNPDLERLHLDTVKRRRDEMRKGNVEPVDGKDASVLAHRIINR